MLNFCAWNIYIYMRKLLFNYVSVGKNTFSHDAWKVFLFACETKIQAMDGIYR